ncbi:hypothetical protein L3Q82_006020 [Scortum barcoo]|uniref:Uncharacterized protein n=1 Tax=Scortum barcoo TaxID=214431 RepID=A0ACB8X240_9TELE|nr:hypothetical protein L3Q82_006020 [Scortum barcoo]
MFPPLVQFSWKRQKEDGPLEELPPAEGEQLELRESGHTAAILLIRQPESSTYKYRCYVQHEGGTVEAPTEQELPAPAASCPPEREPADLPALQQADLIVQHCSPDVESFFIKCKPSYSPCEFASFILLCVSIPLQANVQEAQRKLAQQILCVERTKPDSLFIVLGDFEKAHLSHQVHAIPHAALGHSDHVMVHLVHSSAQTIRLEKEEVLRSGDRDRFKEAKYRGRTQMQTVEMAG